MNVYADAHENFKLCPWKFLCFPVEKSASFRENQACFRPIFPSLQQGIFMCDIFLIIFHRIFFKNMFKMPKIFAIFAFN